MTKHGSWVLMAVAIAAGLWALGFARADDRGSSCPQCPGKCHEMTAAQPTGTGQTEPAQEQPHASAHEGAHLIPIGPKGFPPEEWPSRFPREGQPERLMVPSVPRYWTEPVPLLLSKRLPDADAILRHAQELSLTREQVAKLKEMRLEASMKAVEWHAACARIRLKLDAALDAERVDLAAVRKMVHAEADAEAELRCLDIELSVKARELLEPEQGDRLKELVADEMPVLPPQPWPVLLLPGAEWRLMDLKQADEE